jgi:cell division protease FtsH
VVIALAAGPWLIGQLGLGEAQQRITYTEFREQVRSGNVTHVTVSGQEISGELSRPDTVDVGAGQPITYSVFTTYLPSFGDDELLSLLEGQSVEVQSEPAPEFSGVSLLINLVPWVFLIGLGYFLLGRMQSQGQSVFSMRESQARLYDRREEGTTFDDVAGADAAKA